MGRDHLGSLELNVVKERITVVVMAISFICCNSKFSLAFVIFNDALNDTSLLILLEKVSSFKFYNSQIGRAHV